MQVSWSIYFSVNVCFGSSARILSGTHPALGNSLPFVVLPRSQNMGVACCQYGASIPALFWVSESVFLFLAQMGSREGRTQFCFIFTSLSFEGWHLGLLGLLVTLISVVTNIPLYSFLWLPSHSPCFSSHCTCLCTGFQIKWSEYFSSINYHCFAKTDATIKFCFDLRPFCAAALQAVWWSVQQQ